MTHNLRHCCSTDSGEPHLTDCPSYGSNKSPITPSHYQGDSVMVFIEQFKLGFCLGNVIKYVSRAQNKNGLEDLKKARWYLDREIQTMEKDRT